MRALVSIVIPAFNHASYLEEAINSVLGQDYPWIELIVLDDGSTDNTRDVLARYQDRFYYESQQNTGQAETLNKGWQMSRGSILGYLSADDLLLPDAVRAAVECLQDNPDVVLTYSDFNLIDPHSRVIRRVNTAEFDYRDMLVKLSCPPGPGAFFRRSGFEATGRWDSALRQMPDYDYWLRLGVHGHFKRIPRVLAAFRVHDASQTFSKTDKARAMEPVLILSRLFDSGTLPEPLMKVKDKALSNANVVSAQLHIRAGRYVEAGHCFWTAVRWNARALVSVNSLRLVLNALFNRVVHKCLWTLTNLIARARGIARGP